MSIYISDEVVAEILTWLPVKWIILCRCVCKSWNSLITSSYFISTHLRKTLITKNSQIFLHQIDHANYSSTTRTLHFDNRDYFRSMSVQFPVVPSCRFEMVGSVNGLICFSFQRRTDHRYIKFILFNPEIGYFLSVITPAFILSCPTNSENVVGFGFDDLTQDYKILSIMSNNAFLFSLNSNCWRHITSSVPKYCFVSTKIVVFGNGRFHWMARNGADFDKFIMVFDLKGETFGQIPLPGKCNVNSRQPTFIITGYGELSVGVIQKVGGGYTHVWGMEEYGSVESWMKLATIKGRSIVQVLGFRNKDELLIKSARGCIASRRIKNKGDRVLMDGRGSFDFTVHNYVPTLVLLDPSYKYRSRPTYKNRIDSAMQMLLLASSYLEST